MRRKKAWQVYPEQPELVAAVMARHNLPRLVARILLNRGLAAARGRYVLVMNPDVEVRPGSLEALIAFMDALNGDPVAVKFPKMPE